jgi:hypothetical protein
MIIWSAIAFRKGEMTTAAFLFTSYNSLILLRFVRRTKLA